MSEPIGPRAREVILVFATLAVVVASVWLFPRKNGRETVPAGDREPTASAESRFAAAVFDSDGDGLLDWEEELWGTDKERQDTDGDGTPDGEEVASRRDPRKAGTGDSLDTPLVIVEQKEPPLVGDTPLAIRPPQPGAGVPLPPEEFPKETPENEPLYAFGNAVGALIIAATADTDAELAFWNSAAGAVRMNQQLIRGFTELAQKYEKLAADITSIVPPEEAAGIHASFAKAYRRYAEAIRAISKTPADSYMSGEAIALYSDAAIALGRAFVDVSDFFYRGGVGFDKTAPGHIFMFPR